MSDIKEDLPLPEQKEGVEKNIESVVDTGSIESAKELFNKAKQRLLDVNNWHNICGKLSSTFSLTDEKGNEISEQPRKGFHFKIDIPGPGSTSGKGYDWVKVEEIQETVEEDKDCEFVLMRVRPTDNPTTDDDNVAHFFSDVTTSNFVVKREKQSVIAAVYGRNEVPNTETENIIDKTRNAVVGVGALAGFSNPQWKSLTEGVLGK
jgi:hypothetical protein